MTLLSLIVTLVAVGVLMWLINQFIPMQPLFRKILNVAVAIVVIVWLAQSFGLLESLNRPVIR